MRIPPALLVALLAASAGAPAAAQENEAFKVTAPGAAADDRLGESIALDGDTLVVGAPRGNGDTGAAYVFVRSGLVWSFEAVLLASNGMGGDWFGGSVALDGDTAVVGARFHATPDPMMPGSTLTTGAAYVFVRSGTAWSEQAMLLGSDNDDLDWFGQSVSVSGDTIAVGSNFQDASAGFGAGAAYVFTRAGTVWSEEMKILPMDPAGSDFFGWSVSVDGDTLLVGSEFDDDNGAESGSAYVFTRVGTVWTQEAKLLAPGGSPDDQFGVSVALDGDTAAVGAVEAPFMAPCCPGSAYVFTRSGTTWSFQQQLQAADGMLEDHFGGSLALDGDRLAVGALHDDDLGTDAGVAFVFERSGTTWTQTRKLRASDGAAGDFFGDSVAISGVVVAVGGSRNDEAAADAGAGYLYDPMQSTVTYCTGKTNSVGCVPFVSATGAASASSSAAFTLRANDVVPSEAGLLLYGFQKANLNFHGGKLCIKAPFTRTPVKTAKNVGGGCSDWTLTRNFNATIQSGNDPQLTAGQVVRAQWRQRDPADPLGFGDTLTDGIQFTVLP